MNTIQRTLLRIGLSALIIGAGAGVMSALVASGAKAEATPSSDLGVVVRTEKIKTIRQQGTVAGQGLVVPAHEVSLQPEVPGRVVFRSEQLVPGGRFKKGDILLRIDASEYSLRAKQSVSQIEQAQQQLMLEESRGEIAAAEWKLIGQESTSDAGRAVALREPQKKEARARIELAEHARGLAVLNVGRTTLRAPFNGFVRKGLVNVGQYISPAMSLGTLVGSDEFWVKVSVPVKRLASLRVPGFNAESGAGSRVSIWQEVGDERVERKGRVVRLFGDVDPVGRMARVMVRVEDPLGIQLEDESAKPLPLLLGSYVHVDIEGIEMVDVVEIPRSAVHSGQFVYVYGADNRLQIRSVSIAWRKPTSFLVDAGLQDGDEIITSRLGNVVAGLKVRRVATGAAGGDLHHDENPNIQLNGAQPGDSKAAP